MRERHERRRRGRGRRQQAAEPAAGCRLWAGDHLSWRRRWRPRGEPAAGGHPARRVPAVAAAGAGGVRGGAAAADAAGGAGRAGVHGELPHVHVDADLLRPPRHAGARRRLAGEQRHPDLRLRTHGTRPPTISLV